MNQHLLGGFGLYKECGAYGVQVIRSPAFCHTLRTNYGSGLSLLLVTCPSDGGPAKLANHRDGRHGAAGDLGRMQNSSRRHRRLWGLILATRFATRKFSWMRVLSDIACRNVQISPRIRKPVLYRELCCERLLPLRKERQYLFATRKSRECDYPLVVAKSLDCAIEGQWNRKLARNKWPHSAALANESKI